MVTVSACCVWDISMILSRETVMHGLHVDAFLGRQVLSEVSKGKGGKIGKFWHISGSPDSHLMHGCCACTHEAARAQDYLDDWLVCAAPEEQCCRHVALLLEHIQKLSLVSCCMSVLYFHVQDGRKSRGTSMCF